MNKYIAKLMFFKLNLMRQFSDKGQKAYYFATHLRPSQIPK